ncbi:MAG TPA: AraC family transcriptional regulator [Clostridiales bacterium]|nr:AraC family transcriptional regulator [Clostridiales bacterium]
MGYNYIDGNMYEGVHIVRIEDNKNNLPFFIIKMGVCNQTKHMHEFVQIVYMCKGKLKHVINNNTFDVYKGDIFIIPPYVPHYFIAPYDDKFELIEFEFIPEFINEKFSVLQPGANSNNSKVIDSAFMDFAYLEPFLVSEHEVKPRLNLTGSVQIEVEKILNEVILEYEHRDIDFELIIKALLLKLLIIVGREYKKSTSGTEFDDILARHRDALYEALEYINKNFTKEITIDEAAKVAMLSQSYFRYLFKQMTQKTFTEYINGLRIAKAAELLKNNYEMKVVDICFEVGFNSVNHFNRIFRAETGFTPMQVRKGKMNTGQ